jgi:hypothetical protein
MQEMNQAQMSNKSIPAPLPRRRFLDFVGRLSLFGGGSLLAGATPTLVQAAAPGAAYSREKFEEYIAIFSRNDDDNYGRLYYTQDVLYERGTHVMHGIDEILAFYREVHAHAHQKLKVVNYAATDTFIGAEVHSEFTAFKDWSHSSGVTFKKGEYRLNHNFVHYGLRGGKISHVKSASFKRLEQRMTGA